MKYVFFAAAAACCMICTSCGEQQPSVKTQGLFSEPVNTWDDVTLSVQSSDNVSATLELKSTCDETVYFEEAYRIQVQSGKEWYEVAPEHEPWFTALGYMLTTNYPSQTLELNWADSYGELPAGNYRIVKQISKESESASCYVSAAFEIE